MQRSQKDVVTRLAVIIEFIRLQGLYDIPYAYYKIVFTFETHAMEQKWPSKWNSVLTPWKTDYHPAEEKFVCLLSLHMLALFIFTASPDPHHSGVQPDRRN